MNPARAELLFAGSGHTFAEILALADAGKPLPKFALPYALRAKTAMKRWPVDSLNVAGIAEGSDPAVKHEYIVMSAHLDHLGVGEPIAGDRIYNGAMDDASGIASLIEIARMIHDGKAKIKRSVIFVAVTGEEKGLQGSRYFANHPTVKPDSIVADINMDMFLPLFPLKYLEVQGAGESTLGDQIKAACRDAGVELQNDKEPDRNLFIRSDQYSFIRRGVPALAFKFGYIKGSPEEKIFKEWYKNRYHAPSDDLSQPVDKTAAAQFNHILYDLLERVGNAQDRPHWNDTSFFRRFATQ
jgi:Zn-dependent M28 family amino/carboxypeptidase